MSVFDPFGRTDQLDEATLEALVSRFEARGASPVFSRMLQEYPPAASAARPRNQPFGVWLSGRTSALIGRPGEIVKMALPRSTIVAPTCGG